VSGKSFVAIVGLLAAVPLVGCVLPDQVTKLQKDVAGLQAQIQRLEQQQHEATERLDHLSQQVQGGEDEVGRAEFADLKVRLDDLARQQSVLDERLVEAHRNLERVSQGTEENRELIRQLNVSRSLPEAGATGPDLGAATGQQEASPPPAASPGGAVPSAENLYQTAYADFSKGNYALAISGFEEYANRFPQSDLADNALYWIGECYFSQGNYAVAIEAFDRMLEHYPDSDRAPAANLKKGLAYLNQNMTRQAIVQLRYVVEHYADTDEARVARDKLASLGVR
jgi:tol-pal system protein YbgF